MSAGNRALGALLIGAAFVMYLLGYSLNLLTLLSMVLAIGLVVNSHPAHSILLNKLSLTPTPTNWYSVSKAMDSH